MNAAMFGGSFDPPHIGHEAVIKAALEQLRIDRLFIVPTYTNPFKSDYSAEPEIRLEWMRKLSIGYPGAEVVDFEVSRRESTPSILTVRHLLSNYGVSCLCLIIGADNVERLPRWCGFEELKSLVEFVVATREGTVIPEGYKQLIVDCPISSTMLREKPEPQKLPDIIAPEILDYYERKRSRE